MISRIHSKLGTAGFIISILALVVALGGGAYAASGGLTGKQKKEVEKIAKKYSGKPGKTGAAGPAGANGTNGSNGAKGDTGAAGANGVGTEGKEGKAGKDGESVEAIPVATGSTECAGNGGAVLEPEGIEICNGSPWTVGSLPAGKTEMGAFAVGVANAAETQQAPLSFSVPLSEGSTLEVHFVNTAGHEEAEGIDEGPAANCLGNAVNPSAPAGTLCIYESASFKTIFLTSLGGSRAGRVLSFELEGAASQARGTWAVTAPPSP